MRTNEIPVPENWPHTVRRAVLHAASLAHYAIIYTRSMAANSPIERVRLKGKLDRAQSEISLLREQLGLLKARFGRIPARHRPHYSPFERMAILEHRATRCWNLHQTAEEFLLDEQTLGDWMRRIDEKGGDALVRIPEPTNKFPDFVKHLAQRLKLLSPSMGRKKIAEHLLRAGLQISDSTVRRLLKVSFLPEAGTSGKDTAEEEKPVKRIVSRHPGHTWLVDLTAMPISSGFWTSWIPNALPQYWPFCFWIAIILDHFSRKVVGFAVFRKNPKSGEITDMLGKVARRTGKSPKYIISDKGTQFNCRNYKSWCRRKKIKPRFGAVGKYGSIAIIERFMKSMKTEHLCRIIVPMDADEMFQEVSLYIDWYNGHRPHETLGAKTPEEVYRGFGIPMACNGPPETIPFPKSKTPEFDLDCRHFEGARHLPVVSRKAA